jgi:hypothetical protein
MGLLDDAIREHLDLKRRRGADPTEVARMEQEALGPVRREPTSARAQEAGAHDEAGAHEEAGTSAPHPPADEHAHVLAPEERHEGAHGDPLRAAAPPVEEAAAAAEPEPEHEMTVRGGAASQHAEPDRGREPQLHEHGQDHLLQPTTEFRVEDHHDDEDERAAAAAPSEDVLEETPDFLQETPEHDRLWFEQRPPRDFDFDG